jgi:hypothetical protein
MKRYDVSWLGHYAVIGIEDWAPVFNRESELKALDQTMKQRGWSKLTRTILLRKLRKVLP